MTIRKGESWGRRLPPPAGLRTVDGDRALAIALADGSGRPARVTGGDMARTLGTVGPGGQTEVNELPVDLLHATLGDGSEADAVAHVVVRAPALRGSWWREEVLFVMNAQFHGRWEPVPRVHPNDGRADVLRVAASLGVRQRLLAARRARHGAHLPHPALAVSRIVSAEWTFPRPMVVVVDGCVIGSTRQLTVAVRPDGGVVYV